MSAKPIAEIDHLLTSVHDLDAAASLFRRMGFTLSPISVIESMGISNHLVLMTPRTPGTANFIELMCAHDRAKLPPPMVRTLSGGEGIKSMVLVAADIDKARAAMVDAGFDAGDPFHIRREWVIAPGQSVFPEFDVILPVDAPLTFNCCRYYNVELYLRPEWLVHENGARHMRSVLAVAADPDAVAAPLGRLFGGVRKEADGVRVSPGHVDLCVLGAGGLKARFGIAAGDLAPAAARYLGYEIAVESCERMAACLDRGAVPYRDVGGALVVDPDNGLGNLIVFTTDPDK